ncbi:MAG: NAD kinase [Candidatus Nanopelagicaceae bacterium]|nr:NAD kinase [Candidatus Nanopelagicaceae bacterium]
MNSKRAAVLVVNPSRSEAVEAAAELTKLLQAADFELYTTSDVTIAGVKNCEISNLPTVEVAVVLGGDGTILRGAELTRERNIPLLGINIGHVGFMAEVIRPEISAVAKSMIDKSYSLDSRMVLAYEVIRGGKIVNSGWALNEVTVERQYTTMVELFVQIDGRPLSRWGCDGLIASTPTGSTAYAFSAGGPVLWPEVEALVLLPISAHALFSRPMVISPKSEIIVVIESAEALLSADALRKFPLEAGDQVRIVRDASKVALSHIVATTFTDRIVAKFKLPVEGWRGE